MDSIKSFWFSILFVAIFPFHLAASTPEPITQALPEIRFASNLDDEFSFDVIKASPLFEKLTKDAPGSPIRLVSMVQSASTAGGDAAAITSMLLSASTLGVVPVVSNDDITITYRIYVNGNTLFEYNYTENFTDADFFWAMDFTLSEEARVWAASTVEQFLQDVEQNQNLKDLISEYNYYFSESAE